MEKYFIAAMSNVHSLGNRSIAQLIKFFGSAKAAWFTDVSDLVKAGVNKKVLNEFISFRDKNPNAPEKLISFCDSQKIKLCSIADKDYPPLLKEIDTPPMVFYYRGELQPHIQRIAVVGSRNNTPCGQRVALELGEELAAMGLTVVSGAARGIDTFAHFGVLKTGRTVAVLGCGINHIFPRENKKLLEEIAERGVVMSEYPPQMPPNRGTFPQRNRIIAGLCKGLVVVEAAKKSGSIIACNFALKYGRKLFAVQNTNSGGCKDLIRAGAIPIETAQDVYNRF